MPDDLKARKAKLQAERDDLERRIAEKIAELEKGEERRAELKRRSPKQEEVIAKIEEALKDLHAELTSIRNRLDAMDTASEKLAKRIKSLSRRIRNALKPKIVDLHMTGSSSAMGPLKGCVGHYTAGPIARTDEEAVRMWWQVRSQHMNQGWSNIGYHIGLGPEGGIYLLRPRQYAGAHTLGYNTGYIGFSVHGTTGDTWTKAQLRAYRYALKHFGYSNLRVYRHSDLNPTACPGSFGPKYVSKGK